MKHIFFIMLIMTFLSQVRSQGIEFEKLTWQESIKLAKAENKLLFVDAYAKWCGPCKKMAKNEFTKVEVGTYFNENFINLKLDMESINGREFDGKYPVSAYPTLLFIDGQGNIVKRIKGARSGDQLIGLGREVLQSFDFALAYKNKYNEGDRSFDIVYNFIKALNKSDKPVLKIANDYLATNPDLTTEQYVLFLCEAASEIDSKNFELLIKQRNEAIKLIGAQSFNKIVKRACKNTVDKAIEYDYEALYEEALSKSKKYLSDKDSEFELVMKKYYGTQINDEAIVIPAYKKLFDYYIKKNNDPKFKSLIKEGLQRKERSSDFENVLLKYAKKYDQKVQNAQSSIIYIQLLIETQQYQKALHVTNKSLEKYDSNEKEKLRLEEIKKKIKLKYL